MSVRRALLNCAVLSLQDSCVFYPCCKGCFSRIHAEKEDSSRFRCPKCGYWCHKDQVDHRYRLSLRVLRDGCIFGVTVFGNSLNKFFGVHANELQRLVENLDGPFDQPTKSTLLVKAVKDCFIGQHFIFGLKFNETGSEPWCQRPPYDGFNREERAQFIASQMLPSTPGGPTGCTVVRYYQVLLQNASESQPSYPGKRLPFTTPLLVIEHNPSISDDSPFSVSGLLSQSWLRLEEQDSTLTFTPPWEQSLGLVTSSAEQEEPCRTLDKEDVATKQTVDSTEPHLVQRVDEENHEVVLFQNMMFPQDAALSVTMVVISLCMVQYVSYVPTY
ncbi:DNA damage-induced apoptosis suppressor protein isoform X2 [Oryzias melastigma]|uniref:DNA damage-induced apoptosis suppressor protein isoform X2 n=1 Tax=Oryzias melastigma TaxID=30732 RepID=UPI000CF83E0A|nr:DNA damage-induced apoptosis suppressor protein isoform X2 [Oryzias melastigma]